MRIRNVYTSFFPWYSSSSIWPVLTLQLLHAALETVGVNMEVREARRYDTLYGYDTFAASQLLAASRTATPRLRLTHVINHQQLQNYKRTQDSFTFDPLGPGTSIRPR